MGRAVYVGAAVEVAAPPEQVFALLTDWDRQREWMFLTSTRQVATDAVEAYTGVWPVGFMDTMTITRWEPPELVVMEHTGRLVRGRGAFRVRALGSGSRVIWTEELLAPFGALGRAGWPLVRPLAKAVFRHSLRELAALVAAERRS
ncbi:SRPBCC family protein [Nonomuraea wenchangensis]|uniref:SRPBCC family protein n=1 Tax=Nonomuraea wenchangensis TaxID=568860 RepID=UPI003430020B